MFYIIVGGITVLALILLIVAINYNKFQFAIIKIDEAENNTDLFLQKKYDLIKRLVPIIKGILKQKEFMEDIKNDFSELNHFELNKKLSDFSSEIFKTLDDNDKLLKSEKIINLMTEFNDNDEDLTASIKFYNDTVVKFNKLIMSFPSNIIRLFFGYKRKDFYADEKREMYEILKDE